MIRVEDLNSMQSQGQNLRTIDPKRGLTFFTVLFSFWIFALSVPKCFLYTWLWPTWKNKVGCLPVDGSVDWTVDLTVLGDWSSTMSANWVYYKRTSPLTMDTHSPRIPQISFSNFIKTCSYSRMKMVSSKSAWLHASTWSTARFLLFLTECQISTVSDLVQKYINFKSCILTQNVKRLNY